VNKYQFSHYS